MSHRLMDCIFFAVILIFFAAVLALCSAAANAEMFEEMWNRRIAEPMGWGPEPVKVKTVEIKVALKKVEPHHRHRRRVK